MKIGFVTSVELGFSCINEIYNLGYRLDLAVTLNDKIAKNKSGRVYLDKFCNEKKIELLKVKNINEQLTVDTIKQKEIDWLFIIGWSQIAKSNILNAPKFGVIGMHPTLLPTGRGRAAIPWAIIMDLSKTGVTAFQLDEGVDTGPIISQIEISLDKHETATTLYAKVNKAHLLLIRKVINQIFTNSLELKPQDNLIASEWPGRKPTDGLITDRMSVIDVDKLVRATTHPYPGAFIIENNNKKIIWSGRIISERNILIDSNILRFSDGFYKIDEFEIKPI